MTQEGTQTVGREAVIDRILATSLSASARGVVLVGPAGIGKSHIARAVAQRQADDTAVVWITGSAATADVPFGAFAPIMPTNAEAHGLPAMLLARLGLTELAAGRRVLLVVDDLHDLDEASAALVHQLAVTGDAVVVATQRAGAPTGDSAARLWRDDILDRIDLGPLDRDATEAIAAALLGGPVSNRSVTQIHERCAGNPLFVRELVLATRDTGEWTRAGDDALWEWQGGHGTTARLTDLMAERLALLSDAERDALQHIAFGEPIGLGELQAVATDEVIDALERSGLITADVDRRRLHIRFTHPMHADVVRRSVTPLRARTIRSTLANVLANTGARRREDDMRLATLALDAGVDVDVTVLRRAARVALFGNDRPLAVRLSEEAFVRAPDFDGGNTLADALYEEGSFAAMLAHWPAWAPLAETDEQRVIVAMHQAIAHFYRNADAASAHAVLDAAIASVSSGPWHDEAVALRSTLLTISGRVVEAWALAEPLLVDRGPDRVLIQAALAATHSLRALGRAHEAMAIADRAIASYEVLGPQATLVSSSMLGITRCLAFTSLGQLSSALATGDAARDASLQSGDTSTEGAAELTRADILTLLGRVVDAEQAARASEVAFARLNHLSFRRWAVSQRALVATYSDDRAALDKALADLDGLGNHPAALFEHATIISRAWRQHLDGEDDGARAALAAGAGRLQERGELVGASLTWNALARLGGRGVGAPLRALADRMDGDLIPALAAHAEALDSTDGTALLAAAERLADLGAVVWAIPAAQQAAAHTDDARTASRATNLAEQWRARCQQVESGTAEQTPQGAASVVSVSPLTRREKEIALLAAQGLPSRTIGERLFLSPRTVENHLARAYDKLGVRSRAELAHALAAA